MPGALGDHARCDMGNLRLELFEIAGDSRASAAGCGDTTLRILGSGGSFRIQGLKPNRFRHGDSPGPAATRLPRSRGSPRFLERVTLLEDYDAVPPPPCRAAMPSCAGSPPPCARYPRARVVRERAPCKNFPGGEDFPGLKLSEAPESHRTGRGRRIQQVCASPPLPWRLEILSGIQTNRETWQTTWIGLGVAQINTIGPSVPCRGKVRRQGEPRATVRIGHGRSRARRGALRLFHAADRPAAGHLAAAGIPT